MLQANNINALDYVVPEGLEWMLFKTNVSTPWQKERVEHMLKMHTDVENWTVDLDDCDHVLRIKPTARFNEEKVLGLMHLHGFEIEIMLD